jgi:hypothetical protein
MLMCKAKLFLLSLAPMLALVLASCSGSAPVTVNMPEISPTPVCPPLEPHPLGVSIAEKYEVPYPEVMRWFCAGEAFEDILLALETQELTGRTLEDLFAMREQMSWDDVWKELNLVP